MSSAACKMMLDTDVVGELEEFAVTSAMPTGKPARFGRVQNEATGDAAHNILSGDVRVVPLLANCFHDVLEAVAGDASLHVITDEFSPGQSPRPIRTKITPSVHGCRNSLRKAFEHGCCSALICSRVTFEAFLPIPAAGVRHGDVGRGNKVMTIVAHVLLALQLVAVLFLEKVDRAIRWRDIPAHSGLRLHVILQESPQSFAEDHVLEVCNPGEDFFGESVRYGTHEKRVPGLAVNDALKDVVLFNPNRHQEKLRGEFPSLSWTKSPLQALLLLGQAPVCCQYFHQVGKLDLEAELDVNV